MDRGMRRKIYFMMFPALRSFHYRIQEETGFSPLKKSIFFDELVSSFEGKGRLANTLSRTSESTSRQGLLRGVRHHPERSVYLIFGYQESRLPQPFYNAFI